MATNERTTTGPSTTEAPEDRKRGHILVVEDDEALRKGLSRALLAHGFEVTSAPDGAAGLETLGRGAFDAVISDIGLPGLGGMDLLRHVRARSPDLPVVLITGAPDLESAVQAVRLGAFEYLVKPLDLASVVETVGRASALHMLARLKREALDLVSGGGMGTADKIGLQVSFDSALSSMWAAYQPIVRASDQSLFGYEALMRSDEKSLPHPGAVLDAAERLGRLQDVGRRMRALVAESIVHADPGVLVFVNLHASDLADAALASAESPLGAIARRVVLEVTERASLDHVGEAKARVAALRSQGYRVAVDDLGAGYAGLTSFATLEPEIVKIDMSLVRGIDQSALKQKLVSAVTKLAKDLGMLVVAEGIETLGERDAIVSLGCDLLQGYLLGRPGRPFPSVSWGT